MICEERKAIVCGEIHRECDVVKLFGKKKRDSRIMSCNMKIILNLFFPFALFPGTPSTPIMPGGTPGTPSSKAKVSPRSV